MAFAASRESSIGRYGRRFFREIVDNCRGLGTIRRIAPRVDPACTSNDDVQRLQRTQGFWNFVLLPRSRPH